MLNMFGFVLLKSNYFSLVYFVHLLRDLFKKDLEIKLFG